MLIVSFIINLIIVVCESITLGHIRGKRNILKYYTYLQNFLALIASFIYSVCLIVCIVSDRTIPEFAKGLRYVATSGLLATMFVFTVFLGSGKKISIEEDDFLSGFRPKTANAMLHYFCPILSLVSFVLFEREIDLSDGVWTGIVAIPSGIYWITYFVLSGMKLWEEPYDFASQGENKNIWEILSVLMIPLSFLAISFVLWNIK